MSKLFTFLLLITLGIHIKAQQVIVDFENFHNYTAVNPFVTLSVPNGWSATDSMIVAFGTLTNLTGTFQAQVKKVTGYSGTGALQVNTKVQDSFLVIPQGPLMAACFNGKLSVDINSGAFTIEGGYPMSGRPATLEFWYKTICKGGDSTSVVATLIDTTGGLENIIGTSTSSYGSDVNTYTHQVSNFDYIPGTETLTPHILRIGVSTAGGSFDLASFTSAVFHDSTSITVDEIAFTFPSGIKEIVYNSGLVKILKNPTKGVLPLQLKDKDSFVGKIISVSGQVMQSFVMQQQQSVQYIDISNLSKGNYTLLIENSKQVTVQTSKFVVE